MKERSFQGEQTSRTLDAHPRAANQDSISEILQAYKSHLAPTVQREAIEEDELLQGKFESNPARTISRTTAMAPAGVFQLVMTDIDKKQFLLFMTGLKRTVAKDIYAKGDMPDKSTEELVEEFIAKIVLTINQKSLEDLQPVYTEGKVPQDVIAMRTEIIDFFRANISREQYAKDIESGRKNQLQERQDKVKDIDTLPGYRGPQKTVTVSIANSIKEKDIDWDVIWNKIMQYGFYPVHIALKTKAPYTDDLKDGSHFREDKKSGGNYFYDVVRKGDNELTIIIHDYWAKKHPDKENPWRKAEGITYTDHSFKVTGDVSKRADNIEKMAMGSKREIQNITEAQKLALADLRYRYIAVDPDGFCLTEAIGRSMGYDGAKIRNDVITRLFLNEADAEINLRIIETFGTVNNFISKLVSPTAWAGELGDAIISGIALVLNISIFVVNGDGTTTKVETPGAGEDVYVTRVLLGGGHFGATEKL